MWLQIATPSVHSTARSPSSHHQTKTQPKHNQNTTKTQPKHNQNTTKTQPNYNPHLGGYTTGRADLITLLRQRARPYLFSNTLAPAVAGASLAVFDLLTASTELRDKLEANTKYFRDRMTKAGFDIRPGSHPIVPIMLGDAALATNMAARMLERGIYVVSILGEGWGWVLLFG